MPRQTVASRAGATRHLAADWPAPADAAAAARLVERFAELGRAEARLAARADIAALLRCLGGNAPYLADLAVREAASLRALDAEGPDAVAHAVLSRLRALPARMDRQALAAALRRAKRALALTVALADIGGLWPLEKVTAALTDLAEGATERALAHLLAVAHDRGEIRLPHPEAPTRECGFTVLGMGKLGARELNYSSDIDLILLYDPDCGIYSAGGGADTMGATTTRIARGLVSLLDTRDADGYVFRTDLRLRPDPAATPPAIAVPAALTYYESMGQNWERAAMIKARPIAGDLPLGSAFLDEIRPFVWRRGLDFAAVADIHAMKRRIREHKGGALSADEDPVAAIAGHNVKLGDGGIREVEFLAQTLQLVWGGREPALRAPPTLEALRQLARAGHLPRAAARELAESYRYLRRVEHRVQMIADRQTHAIPERAEEIHRLALFLGYPDAAAFAAALRAHLQTVRARYAEVFELVPELPGEAAAGPALDFRGDTVPAETEARLAALGFQNLRGVGDAIRGWYTGRVRALRSDRARDLLGMLLPGILAALARQPQPDVVFFRFDALLARLPAGVQILSLFERNPGLIARVAAVLGAAPMLADHLARQPAALEGLLSPEDSTEAPRLLRARLRDARALEDTIEIVRRAVREEGFAISVACMEGRIDADAAGLRRTAMADAALGALLPPVLADFASRNGRVRGGGMAVVALGKAGGGEMMAGSDLDLMLIYDHPPEVTESRGARRVSVSQWFGRVAQSYIAAVTAPGVDGPLYAVDMRLRPSGNKGPVAVSLGAFRRYHAADAWTWERMALTRARVVCATRGMAARVRAAISAALAEAGAEAGAAEKIRADAAAMRARLARELPGEGPWDVKHRPGGLMEVEFIAQVLQLVHAHAHPEGCHPSTRVALARLAEAGLLPAADAARLIHAERVWRTVQGMLRITVGPAPKADLAEVSAAALLRAVAATGEKVVDLCGLGASLDAIARDVRALFQREIGEITT